MMSSSHTAKHAVCSVRVLGSSSAGNATVVRHGNTALLIDCGLPLQYIERHLAATGLHLTDLTAVLLTHVHGDHVNQFFAKKCIKLNIPIYCPADLELQLQARYVALARASHLGLLKRLDEYEHELDSFVIRSFPVPHDSPGGCFGYNIFCQTNGRMKKIAVATDIAFPTPTAVQAMADSDVIVIESNHDLDMLEQSGRPIWLKKRICERGHLSNSQSAEIMLKAIDRSSHLPHSIILAHVSQECNTNALAVESAHSMLLDLGIRNIALLETYPSNPNKEVSASVP